MDAVTVLVSADLVGQLNEWSEPVQIRIVETPGVGTGYEMTARKVFSVQSCADDQHCCDV